MYPDFLCIGAQKAGTTWLHANLETHPQVWLPPVKEIHYFGAASPWPVAVRALNPAEGNYRWRQMIGYRLRELARTGRIEQFGFYARYLGMPRGIAWYGSLFRPAPGQVSGEISPEYARLDREIVARIHGAMPDLRIVYLLRNPISRTWSQTAMYFSKRGHKGLSETPVDAIREFLDRASTTTHADYASALETWETFYPRDRVFVGYFEQLRSDPRGLLRSICEFLQLDASDRNLPETVGEKRYAREYGAIPDELAAHLARKYLPSLERLDARLGSAESAAWLADARRRAAD